MAVLSVGWDAALASTALVIAASLRSGLPGGLLVAVAPLVTDLGQSRQLPVLLLEALELPLRLRDAVHVAVEGVREPLGQREGEVRPLHLQPVNGRLAYVRAADGRDRATVVGPLEAELFRRDTSAFSTVASTSTSARASSSPRSISISAGGDGVVVLWDMESGEALRRYPAGSHSDSFRHDRGLPAASCRSTS